MEDCFLALEMYMDLNSPSSTIQPIINLISSIVQPIINLNKPDFKEKLVSTPLKNKPNP